MICPKASDAAKEARRIIRAQGIDPKGMVHISGTDYTTEVIVRLVGVPAKAREEIEACLDEIESSPSYFWDVS